jgi:hypothetical protein
MHTFFSFLICTISMCYFFVKLLLVFFMDNGQEWTMDRNGQNGRDGQEWTK